MGHGKEFEDALMDTLEEWSEGEGIPILRKQSMSMRRGSFQMNQEMDILVDSANPEYYVGFEAKSRNAESRLGFYFSSDLDIEQIEKGIEYAEISGRDYVVAVELRNYEGSEHDITAWLVSPYLFTDTHEKGEKKVSWEQIDQYGYCIGHDRDYSIDRNAIESVEVPGSE